MTTTITTLHCGCTQTPLPTIPMTTTTKACSCGEDGAASSLTVTYPDTSAIASASASASASAANSVQGSAMVSTQKAAANAASLTPATPNYLSPTLLPASETTPKYSNSSALANGTIAAGVPTAGSGMGTAAPSGDVPLITNSFAGSAAPAASGMEGYTTKNATVTAMATTDVESKPSEGINGVVVSMEAAFLAFFVGFLFA